MLDNISSQYRVLAAQPAANTNVLHLRQKFVAIPQEYIDLISEATEIEIQHTGGAYMRIWGPMGCIDMDEGYEISRRIDGAFPIGDDGGGRVILYMTGDQGYGLYIVGFGDLDAEDARWIAPSLKDLLTNATGIEAF